VLDIISNKWVILIIDKLAIKSYRFGELKREIGGVSAKVLSHSLKVLEHNGLINRCDNSGVILNVEYSLSPLGISLSHVCKTITHWSEQHIDVIIQSKSESTDKLPSEAL
jgi:DNA-binding HxlR family transcriptional regulator